MCVYSFMWKKIQNGVWFWQWDHGWFIFLIKNNFFLPVFFDFELGENFMTMYSYLFSKAKQNNVNPKAVST